MMVGMVRVIPRALGMELKLGARVLMLPAQKITLHSEI